MKNSLLALIPAIGVALAAPAASSDPKAVSVRVHDSDGTEVVESVTLDQYVQIAGTNIDRVDIASPTSCTSGTGPLTCQPTWYFSSSGPIVGLSFTSAEPGYPYLTFGNGQVSSVGLTCSCPPPSLFVRDVEEQKLLIRIDNVDGTVTSGSLTLDQDKQFFSKDIAKVSIGGWTPGLDLAGIHCQPTWHFFDSSPVVGSNFSGNEIGTPDRASGHGKIQIVGLRCSSSSVLMAREDKDGYISIKVLSARGSAKVEFLVPGQRQEFGVSDIGDGISGVEMVTTDDDSVDVTCLPTWYFSATGPVVGLTITTSQPGSPDQTFGNGNVNKVSIECNHASRLLARADDPKPSVDITFRNSNGDVSSVTAPVGVGGGVNGTGTDIITLEIGTGHGIESSKVVCLPIWVFDTGASQAGSPLVNNAAAFLSDIPIGYSRMTKDRPKVTRVEIFCDASPMKPRDASPNINVTAYNFKGASSTASLFIGKAVDLHGKNITSVEIKGADEQIDVSQINCQPIWFVNRGQGHLGYTFNSTNAGNPGYFLHGDDAVTRVAVTCS
ncbi:hypothetical protein CERZMDRAFT_101536 [Cercospora zeae-maydis SCOH1-5]|uniref:Uncharacterized protein n=1 Tax=Cercospora zeae-maydis SCOH1-5 TaxID=717836 RepID=A0A6A6F5P6_9PEZI|nr:hypothetical protein CERZMDRAFT_101536 [Cercospora zeae-maydis SCOH1-5]